MSNQLLAQVPAHWAAAVRPYLQRADEFQPREPVVSYFLRTQAAFVCMQKRTKEDKEGMAFLMKLLEALEVDKKALGSQLEGVDGRTVLTKYALMLFARADDEERTGKSNMTIVRLFYSAAVLLEATTQFTDDGKMDNIAAEKCKYAKYIATRMKKALDAGVPYESPNQIEPPAEAGTDGQPAPAFTTAPPASFMPSQPIPPPQQPQTLPYITGANPSPPPLQQQQQQQMPPPAFPPPVDDIGAQGPPPTYSQVPGQRKSSVQQPPQLPTPKHQPPPPAAQPARPQNTQPMPTYTPPANASGPAPSVDAMIDAQKCARKAVSALQFYDHQTARKELISALNLLDGK